MLYTITSAICMVFSAAGMGVTIPVSEYLDLFDTVGVTSMNNHHMKKYITGGIIANGI